MEDTFKIVLPHDCMDIHMFNKVKKTVNNKELLSQAPVGGPTKSWFSINVV
jgi:hypothetical protein